MLDCGICDMIKKCDICGVRWSTNQYPDSGVTIIKGVSSSSRDYRNKCPANKSYRYERTIGGNSIVYLYYTCKEPHD